MNRRLTTGLGMIVLLAACAKEPPPRSVQEFLDNPILLEAAMVRCSQDRSRLKYDAECVNARTAVSRIQAKEEAERQKQLEAQSERKRKALRRTQQAAAEARRRAAEAERRREEAEYLAQFGVLPPQEGQQTDTMPEGNLPIAVVPEATEQPQVGTTYDAPANITGSNVPVAEPSPTPPQNPTPAPQQNAAPAIQPNQAPAAQSTPVAEPQSDPAVEEAPADISSIRDELRRRNEEDDN